MLHGTSCGEPSWVWCFTISLVPTLNVEDNLKLPARLAGKLDQTLFERLAGKLGLNDMLGGYLISYPVANNNGCHRACADAPAETGARR